MTTNKLGSKQYYCQYIKLRSNICIHTVLCTLHADSCSQEPSCCFCLQQSNQPAQKFNLTNDKLHQRMCIPYIAYTVEQPEWKELDVLWWGTVRHALTRNLATTRHPIWKSLQSMNDLQVHPRSSQLLILDRLDITSC